MTALLSRDLTIVVVDDDHGHCELATRNLRRAGVMNEIIAIHSGREAVDAILRRPDSSLLPRESEIIVLLDINMPGSLDGFDVLQAIKTDPVSKAIPVIMLTTTDDPRDVKRCYEIGCNVYITKPVDPAKFMEAVARLEGPNHE